MEEWFSTQEAQRMREINPQLQRDVKRTVMPRLRYKLQKKQGQTSTRFSHGFVQRILDQIALQNGTVVAAHEIDFDMIRHALHALHWSNRYDDIPRIHGTIHRIIPFHFTYDDHKRIEALLLNAAIAHRVLFGQQRLPNFDYVLHYILRALDVDGTPLCLQRPQHQHAVSGWWHEIVQFWGWPS